MKKRTVVIVVAVLTIVVSAAAITILSKKPVEDMIRNRVLNAAGLQIGRRISTGDFGGNPFTGFKVKRIMVEGPKRVEHPTVEMKALGFSISFPDLLRRKIYFKEITLVEPRIYVERSADGTITVSDIFERLSKMAKQPEKAPFVFFERVRIERGTLVIIIKQPNGKTKKLVSEPINITFEPVLRESYDSFRIKMDSKIDGISVSAAGALVSKPALALDISWQIGDIDLAALPDAAKEYAAPLKNFKVAGRLSPKGNLVFKDGNFKVAADVSVSDGSVMEYKLGDGKVHIDYKDRKIVFAGGLNNKGSAVDANGWIFTSEPLKLGISWQIGEIDLAALPEAAKEYTAPLKNFKVSGRVSPKGNLALKDGNFRVAADVSVSDGSVMEYKLGDGKVHIDYKDRKIVFAGGLKNKGSAVDASGWVFASEPLKFDVAAQVAVIDVAAMAKKFAPKTPELLTGTAAGTLRITGEGSNPDEYLATGDVTVRNGNIYYPTPVIHGDAKKQYWAPIPFSAIKAGLSHRFPVVTVRYLDITGDAVRSSGSGKIKYRKDKRTGAPAGPISFDAAAKLSSPEIGKILALNKQLGPFVTGALNAKGKLKGGSDDTSSFAGVCDFSLTGGVVVNPYNDRAAKLPINADLSHFRFDSLKGNAVVGAARVNFPALALRSEVINADASGALGFKGDINGHAKASLPVAMVGKIMDFKNAMPKLKELNDLKRIDTSFDFSGTIQQPKITWNVDEVLRSASESFIKKKASKAIDKFTGPGTAGDGKSAEDNIKQKLKDKLKGMF